MAIVAHWAWRHWARCHSDQANRSRRKRSGRGHASSSRRRTSGTVSAAGLLFSPRSFSCRLLTAIDEPGVGQQRQRDMPIPAGPRPHFVAVEAGLAFGFLDTLLDHVAGAGHLREPVQGTVRGAEAR